MKTNNVIAHKSKTTSFGLELRKKSVRRNRARFPIRTLKNLFRIRKKGEVKMEKGDLQQNENWNNDHECVRH